MKPPAGIFPCCSWKQACNCSVAQDAPRLSLVRSDWLSPLWMDLQRRGITVMPVRPAVLHSSLCLELPHQEPLFLLCYDPHGGNEMQIWPLSEVLWWIECLLFSVLFFQLSFICASFLLLSVWVHLCRSKRTSVADSKTRDRERIYSL